MQKKSGSSVLFFYLKVICRIKVKVHVPGISGPLISKSPTLSDLGSQLLCFLLSELLSKCLSYTDPPAP